MTHNQPNQQAMRWLTRAGCLQVLGIFIQCDGGKSLKFAAMVEAGWRALFSSEDFWRRQGLQVQRVKDLRLSVSPMHTHLVWWETRVDPSRAEGPQDPAGAHDPTGTWLVAKERGDAREVHQAAHTTGRAPLEDASPGGGLQRNVVAHGRQGGVVLGSGAQSRAL